MFCLKKKSVLFLLAGFVIFFPGNTIGDEFKLIPFLDLKEEYNDNIFFSEKKKEEDFITTVSPGLKLVNRTERFDTTLSGRLDILSYSDNHDLNAVDYDCRGGIGYKLTQKTSINAGAGYSKDSRVDRDIDVGYEGEATGLVQTNTTRIRRNFSFSGNSILTEKASFLYSYSFSRDDFEDIAENDIDANNMNLGFTHRLGFFDEITLGRIFFGYARYDYHESEAVYPGMGVFSHYYQSTDVDYYSLTIGASREIGEVLSILIDVGGSYTRSEFENSSGISLLENSPIIYTSPVSRGKNSNTGMIARSTLSFKGETYNWDFNFSHDIKGSSGRSGPTERTSVSLDMVKRFSAKLRGKLMLGCYLNKSDPGDYSLSGTDEKTYRISPVITYEIFRDFMLDASYVYTHVEDKDDDEDKKRKFVFIRLRFNYPLFE